MKSRFWDIEHTGGALKHPPWFSLGFHIDIQKKYIDLHILWWIITIGRSPFNPQIEEKS